MITSEESFPTNNNNNNNLFHKAMIYTTLKINSKRNCPLMFILNWDLPLLVSPCLTDNVKCISKLRRHYNVILRTYKSGISSYVFTLRQQMLFQSTYQVNHCPAWRLHNDGERVYKPSSFRVNPKSSPLPTTPFPLREPRKHNKVAFNDMNDNLTLRYRIITSYRSSFFADNFSARAL